MLRNTAVMLIKEKKSSYRDDVVEKNGSRAVSKIAEESFFKAEQF